MWCHAAQRFPAIESVCWHPTERRWATGKWGPSVALGYLDDPDATTDVFRPDGLRTGDLGYLVDGQLYVTGRSKDLIIINGRNIDPSSVEWVAEAVAGVRKGNVAAFSISGDASESVVIVAERRDDAAPDLADRMARAVTRELGIPVAHVVVLSAGELPKTTSGKVRRSTARELYFALTPDRQ
jgi:acyl-CoA synthetase (AMP-forming)/AMP-acid ligase II